MATRQYIGARYVPKFFEGVGGSNDWVQGITYEPLTVVTYSGTIYTSKKPVPATVGSPNLNLDYWVVTGQSIPDVTHIMEELAKLDGDIEVLQQFKSCIGVTPEMFGAVGNGVDDDTDAVVAAITYANAYNLPVILSKKYLVNDTITMPSETSIISINPKENPPTIIAGDEVELLFDCGGVRNGFSNIRVTTVGDSYRDDLTLFRLSGNSSGNADHEFYNVEIRYANTGVLVKGRNIKFENCNFSHCRYGLEINGADFTQLRGIVVHDCRFHGIGEDVILVGGVSTEILTTNNCAGILLDCARNSGAYTEEADVMITCCLSDRGGTFVKGKAHNCKISDCMIIHYEKPGIVLVNDNDNPVAITGGSIEVTNNRFFGNSGTDSQGISHEYPNYSISIEHYTRVIVSGNTFSRSYTPFKLDNAADISIVGNTLAHIAGSAADRKMIYGDDLRINVVGNSYVGAAGSIDMFRNEPTTAGVTHDANARITYNLSD